ncbi:MAG: hypothetical protein PHC61_06370 [Chitinivibrionales bacterium]|nr:hypothetical protein [Chitinivibrionales bacterium]
MIPLKAPDPDFELLMHALAQRGVVVRWESCGSDGGLVRLRDEYQLLLNPRIGPQAQKQVMVTALGHLKTSDGFVHPRLRQLLGEKEWAE